MRPYAFMSRLLKSGISPFADSPVIGTGSAWRCLKTVNVLMMRFHDYSHWMLMICDQCQHDSNDETNYENNYVHVN